MKPLIIFIIFLILIPFALAQTVNFFSESIAPGEVLQAEIISSEKLLPADIKLLNPYGYPTIFGINFIILDANYYFIHVTIPESTAAGAYNLKIKDTDFPFQITEPKQSYATFSPTFIKYEDGEKYIKINLANPSLQETEYLITSSYEAITPSVSSLVIPPKSTKSFYIHINSVEIKQSLIATLSINEYTLPIYVVKDTFPTQIISKISVSKDVLIFYTKKDSQETPINYLQNTLTEQKSLEGELFIKNNLNTTITNLNLELTGNLNQIVELDKSSISELKPEESIAINLIVNKEKSLTEEVYDGSLTFTAQDFTIEFPIHFDVEESLAPVETEAKPEPLITEEKVEKIPEKTPPKKSYKKYLGVLIILLLAGVLYYYYFGKKEHKKSIKFSEYLKNIR